MDEHMSHVDDDGDERVVYWTGSGAMYRMLDANGELVEVPVMPDEGWPA